MEGVLSFFYFFFFLQSLVPHTNAHTHTQIHWASKTTQSLFNPSTTLNPDDFRPLLFCTKKLERVRTCTHKCYPINGTTWLEMPILHLCASINLKSTSLFDYENTAPTFASFGIQSHCFSLFKQVVQCCELFTGIFSFTILLSCCHVPVVEGSGSIIKKESGIIAKLSHRSQPNRAQQTEALHPKMQLFKSLCW